MRVAARPVDVGVGPTLIIDAAGASHAGKVRTLNEDSLVVLEGVVYAVADGMGGHAAGEVASRIAVQRLAQLDGAHGLRPGDIASAIAEANDLILMSSVEHPERRGMGTTVSGIAVVQVGGAAHWAVFNVGDSRVYRFADGVLVQVTTDHSEVEELLAAGQITGEQARSHPNRNVITRSLGTDPGPKPDLWVFPPRPVECFLICSDGLTSELDDDQIARVLREHPDADTAASVLVQAAVDAGGSDNVTVVVVRPSSSSQVLVNADTAPRVLLRDEH